MVKKFASLVLLFSLSTVRSTSGYADDGTLFPVLRLKATQLENMSEQDPLERIPSVITSKELIDFADGTFRIHSSGPTKIFRVEAWSEWQEQSFFVAFAICEWNPVSQSVQVLRLSLDPWFVESHDLVLPLIQKLIYFSKNLGARKVIIDTLRRKTHSPELGGVYGVLRGSYCENSRGTGFVIDPNSPPRQTKSANEQFISTRLVLELSRLTKITPNHYNTFGTPGLMEVQSFFSLELESPESYKLESLVENEDWIVVPLIIKGKVISAVALTALRDRYHIVGDFLRLRGIYQSPGADPSQINLLLNKVSNMEIDGTMNRILNPRIFAITNRYKESICANFLAEKFGFRHVKSGKSRSLLEKRA